ncbi:MAG: MBL fold metallo-hydrolase, partial [Chitinophagaceae bacterium]
VLQTPSLKLFLGGDSGYDKHFAEIGRQYGPFDLAILENGQYDKSWRYIHLLPEEFLTAAKDLNAKKILPVHSSKFGLGNHSWDEPLKKLAENNAGIGINIITPMIGEPVYINDPAQHFNKWWENVK